MGSPPVTDISWSAPFGQDKWVHKQVGDQGFFIDVGASEGWGHSNTYGLEQVGWTGILIDGLRRHCIRAKTRRTSPVLLTLISDKDGIEPFVRVHKRSFVGDASRTDTVPRHAQTLTSICDMFLVPDEIAYLSIDVEGSEHRVLRGLDFSRYAPRLITVEFNEVSYPEVFEILDANGYRMTKEFQDDRGFVRVGPAPRLGQDEWAARQNEWNTEREAQS